VFAVLVLVGSWLMSFLTIARPIRALTMAMDKLAGGVASCVRIAAVDVHATATDGCREDNGRRTLRVVLRRFLLTPVWNYGRNLTG
jgi:hypothetical protein